MAETPQRYAVGKRNKVQRYRNRAVYDYDFIHSVVNTASVAHVAFPPSLDENADPFPALLPMIAIMARYPNPDEDSDSEALDLYLHGYVSSRLSRLSSTTLSTAATDPTTEPGLPLTVSATIVDGIVLSLTPNSHSYNYRSAVLQGYGTPVKSDAEKLFAMRAITEKVVPGRWENSRVPPNRTEMKTTNILRVRVVSASGKERKGGPGDDRHDLGDEGLRGRVWTGVLPVWEERGVPVRAETEAKEGVPGYLEEARVEGNEARRKRAVGAVGEKVK